MKMKKEFGIAGYQLIHKTDSSNRVLPVSEAALPPPIDVSAESLPEKKKNKDDVDDDQTVKKIKRISMMKDLIRWATTAKYQKGGKYFGRKVLQLRNKAAALRSIPDEGELNWSNDSPKISFRWDVESCSSSTISMASSSSLGVHDLFLSALHPSNHTKGNWITTDSEFVVLEL